VCEKARYEMSQKQAQAKTTEPNPPVNTEEDPLAYELWLTRKVERGPVEERGAAEGLLIQALQRRGPQKRSGNKILKKHVPH
jgi:hypothetical protein